MSLTSYFSYNLSFAKWTGLLVRVGFAALLLLTSFYCLLAYIPDTYFAFIQAPFQAWLPAFIRFHPLFFGLLAGAWSWSALRDRPAESRLFAMAAFDMIPRDRFFNDEMLQRVAA